MEKIKFKNEVNTEELGTEIDQLQQKIDKLKVQHKQFWQYVPNHENGYINIALVVTIGIILYRRFCNCGTTNHNKYFQ